jgi:NADH-quinone oxidoreductase subunit A
MSGSEPIIPVLVMFVVASIVTGAMLFIAYFLGPRRLSGPKIETYECGMPPVGSSRDRVSVKYYLVAILFLLFDLEVAFLIPVAIVWQDLIQVGPVLIGLMGFFMFFFVLGIWYELKMKAIDWK